MARGDGKTVARPQAHGFTNPSPNLAIYLVLLLATFAAYFQTREFAFVAYDDQQITENPLLTRGISAQGVAWACTSGDAANWFPVTRLSHMLDFQVFGARSGWHHLNNALIHAFAALMLFAFLKRATGARWRSALVAFLFAMHPLHIESVAWVSERKDVLCAFFWFLTLWAYVRYAERPGRVRYLLVVLPFCLGLMSKPMMVTLPFVLLLLDVWPLERLHRGARLLWEKVPLIALSAGASAIAYTVQKSFGAVEQVSAIPIAMRVENALISYGAYLVKMFWPADLAVLYPYPASFPAWQIALAFIVVAGMSIVSIRWYRQRPYLAVGWFWYLGTLIPVIGLVQVGLQSRADRYTYIPMVGISIMVAWGAAEMAERWPGARPAIVSAAAAACFLASVVTVTQLPYWKNSETLFRRAIAVTEGNWAMHYNLAVALSKDSGRLPEAVSEYESTLRTKPGYINAHMNLGVALTEMPGRLPEAIAELQTAVRGIPGSADAHYNLGVALAKIPDRLPEAIAEYRAALRINPRYTNAHYNLGIALAQMPGGLTEAIAEYEAALRLQPDYAEVHSNLGQALARVPGRLPDAVSHLEAAARIKPDSADAHLNLGAALSAVPGRLPDAIAEFKAALAIRPDFAQAHYDLAVVLSNLPGRLAEAVSEYQAALRIAPDYPDARRNMEATQQALDRGKTGRRD